MPHPRISICLAAGRQWPFADDQVDAGLGRIPVDVEVLSTNKQGDSSTLASEKPLSPISSDGQLEAWNSCLDRATGEFIYLVPPGHAMSPDCLERLCRALDQHPDCDIAHCQFKAVDEGGREISSDWSLNSAFAQSSRELVSFPHIRFAPFDGLLHLAGAPVFWTFSQLLIRRCLFEKLGRFELCWGPDADFHLAMRAALIAHIIHVPETWGGVRVRSCDYGAWVKQSEKRLVSPALMDNAFKSVERFLTPTLVPFLGARWRKCLSRKQIFTRQLRSKKGPVKKGSYVIGRLALGDLSAWNLAASHLTGCESWAKEPADEIHDRLRKFNPKSSLVRLPACKEAERNGSAPQGARVQRRDPRVLLISSVPTHPATAGNRQRVLSLCEQLESFGYPFHLFVFAQEEGDPDAMRRRWGETRFTYFPFVCRGRPMAAWRRIRNLGLRAIGLEKYHPMDIDFYRNRTLGNAIVRTAEYFRPDCAIVSYTFHSWILELFGGGKIRRVIDTHDALTDRFQRFLSMGAKPEWFSTSRVQERKGLQRADCVMAIQKQEAEFFRSISSTPVVTVGSFVPSFAPSNPITTTPTVLFVGSGNQINRDAVDFCFTCIWPKLRMLVPEARLRLVGPICREISSVPAGVELSGIVADLGEAYSQAHVVLCPLRLGTGLKIKCIEALGYGKALVTTRSGAEGLEKGTGTAFLLADDAENLASACAVLLKDAEKRRAMENGAVDFVRKWNVRYRAALRNVVKGEYHHAEENLEGEVHPEIRATPEAANTF